MTSIAQKVFPASFRSITKLHDMDMDKVNLIHNTDNTKETIAEMEGVRKGQREGKRESACVFL